MSDERSYLLITHHSLLITWSGGDPAAQESLDLFDGRVAVLLLLGEDQLPVDHDLEHSSEARNELQFGDLLPELVQQRLRQAHGLREVVSHAAVFDRDGNGMGLTQSCGLPLGQLVHSMIAVRHGVYQGVPRQEDARNSLLGSPRQKKPPKMESKIIFGGFSAKLTTHKHKQDQVR